MTIYCVFVFSNDFRSNTKGRNYVIRRDLFKDNRSEWFLNGKQAKVKEVSIII